MAIQLNNGVTDEYLVLANDATPISTGATTAWSMALWFYRDTESSPAAHEHIALICTDTVGVSTTGSGVRVSSTDILQTMTSGGQSTIQATQATGVWTYAAVTYGNSSGTAYYGTTPGTLTAGTGRGNVAGTLDTLIVGRSPASSAQIFRGRIAHLRIWTGALSQAEFEAEMALDSHLKTSGLWAAYEFPSTTLGAMIADSSGNGRNLTSTNILLSNWIAGPLTSSQSNCPRASLLRMLRSA
jgi:hypothetical protein